MSAAPRAPPHAADAAQTSLQAHAAMHAPPAFVDGRGALGATYNAFMADLSVDERRRAKAAELLARAAAAGNAPALPARKRPFECAALFALPPAPSDNPVPPPLPASYASGAALPLAVRSATLESADSRRVLLPVPPPPGVPPPPPPGSPPGGKADVRVAVRRGGPIAAESDARAIVAMRLGAGPEDLLAVPSPRPKGRRRPSILPRGSSNLPAPVRREARKTVLYSELVAVLPPACVANLLAPDGGHGLTQVTDPRARSDVLHTRLWSHGGPEGGGFEMGIRAVAALAAEAVRRKLADPHAFTPTASSALVHAMIQRAQMQGEATGVGGAGASMRSDLRWLRFHGGGPIDWDDALFKAAAPMPKEIPGAGSRKAATLLLKVRVQFELLARGTPIAYTDAALAPATFAFPEGSPPLFTLRSLLLVGWDARLRVQDMDEIAATPVDRWEPDTAGHVQVRLGKRGEPFDAFFPFEGVLGPYTWAAHHLGACRAAGTCFPAWRKPHGSAGVVWRATEVLPIDEATGCRPVATKDDLRQAIGDLCRVPPYSLSEAEVADLRIRGHSLHGSTNDWQKTIGEQPEPPFPVDSTEPPILGFTQPERTAHGHWFGQAEDAPTPQPPQPPTRGRGRARGRGRGRAAQPLPTYREAMPELYSRGEGRLGNREDQLRLSRRLFLYVGRALHHWTQVWQCAVTDLPRHSCDLLILTRDPAMVPPDGRAPPGQPPA